jgi:hypothetical protein
VAFGINGALDIIFSLLRNRLGFRNIRVNTLGNASYIGAAS